MLTSIYAYVVVAGLFALAMYGYTYPAGSLGELGAGLSYFAIALILRNIVPLQKGEE